MFNLRMMSPRDRSHIVKSRFGLISSFGVFCFDFLCVVGCGVFFFF